MIFVNLLSLLIATVVLAKCSNAFAVSDIIHSSKAIALIIDQLYSQY